MLKRAFKTNNKSPLSPAREALRQADAAVATGRATVTGAEERITRLDALIAADGPAQRALAASVNGDAGKIERFAAGDGSELGSLVSAADSAARAAKIAQAALPPAKGVLAEAVAELARREADKRAALAAVLIEEADAIGRRYCDAFAALAAEHDALVAFARGSGLTSVQLSDAPFEAPRFNLPCMPSGATFSPYLRHAGGASFIATKAMAWRRLAMALASDPAAQFGDAGQPAKEFKSLVIERRRESAHPDVNEVLYDAR